MGIVSNGLVLILVNPSVDSYVLIPLVVLQSSYYYFSIHFLLFYISMRLLCYIALNLSFLSLSIILFLSILF